MRQIVIVFCVLTVLRGISPPLTPYVSCIDGHLVLTLADCPPPNTRTYAPSGPYGGGPVPRGGGGSGGLLGGLLGGIF